MKVLEEEVNRWVHSEEYNRDSQASIHVAKIKKIQSVSKPTLHYLEPGY